MDNIDSKTIMDFIKDLPNAVIGTAKGTDVVLDLINAFKKDEDYITLDKFNKFLSESTERRFNFTTNLKEGKKTYTTVVRLQESDKDYKDQYVIINSDNVVALELALGSKYNCGMASVKKMSGSMEDLKKLLNKLKSGEDIDLDDLLGL